MSDEEQNVADGGGRDLRHPRPGARARPKKIVNTPRKNRTWTEEQIRLLGTLPDGEVGRMIGKPGKATGGGQFGFLQARPIEDKILADARTRHAPLSRFDWAGKEQGVFLHFRLLPEPGVLQPESTDGALGESLGKRLFKGRLELISELDRTLSGAGREGPEKEFVLRKETAYILREEVAAMNLENFVVRAKRRLVEKYAKSESWDELKLEGFYELEREIAGLPSEQEAEDEEAKRFDLLILNLQLAVLRTEPAFVRLRDRYLAIAPLAFRRSSRVAGRRNTVIGAILFMIRRIPLSNLCGHCVGCRPA